MGLYSAVSISGPSEAAAGQRVDLTITVWNITFGWKEFLLGVLLNGNIGVPVDGGPFMLEGRGSRSFSGSFTMPSQDALVTADVMYEDLPGQWLTDESDSLTIQLTIAPPPPPPPPPARYTLDVWVQPQGAGFVNIRPDQASYEAGTVVTLVATAFEDYRFGSWREDASGTSATVQIVMDRNKSVTAEFVAVAPPPPPPPPPAPPASDIKDWDFMAVAGTYDLGDSVPLSAVYDYKGHLPGDRHFPIVFNRAHLFQDSRRVWRGDGLDATCARGKLYFAYDSNVGPDLQRQGQTGDRRWHARDRY